MGMKEHPWSKRGMRENVIHLPMVSVKDLQYGMREIALTLPSIFIKTALIFGHTFS